MFEFESPQMVGMAVVARDWVELGAEKESEGSDRKQANDETMRDLGDVEERGDEMRLEEEKKDQEIWVDRKEERRREREHKRIAGRRGRGKQKKARGRTEEGAKGTRQRQRLRRKEEIGRAHV